MSSPYPAYGNPQLHVEATSYMYPPNNYLSLTDSTTTVPGKHEFAPYPVSRTPSPTPSEAAELARESVFDWKKLASWRFWIRRDWLCMSILSFISPPHQSPVRVLCDCHHPRGNNRTHHHLPSPNR